LDIAEAVRDLAQTHEEIEGSGDIHHSVYGDLEFALDHLVNFFLRMEVLVNGGAAREIVMRKRHTRRVKIAFMPRSSPSLGSGPLIVMVHGFPDDWC
jgi:hypothetical protein